MRLINVNKLNYERCDDSATMATFDFVCVDDIEDAETILNIPDNPTNGDMIKAMVPNLEYEIIENTVLTDMDTGTWFSLDWWNAPCKGVDHE